MATTYSRSDWGARAPRPGPGRLDSTDVVGLAFHWPAMSRPLTTVTAVMSALRSWQNYHMDQLGWSDIAYQVAVDQAGNLYGLRGLRTQSGANGSGEVNEDNGAVLLVLAPGEHPSKAMIGTVRRVVKRHRRLFPNSRLLVGHNDIRPEPTACPGPAATAALRAGTFEPRAWTRGIRIDHALADISGALEVAKPGSPRAGVLEEARRALRKLPRWQSRR